VARPGLEPGTPRCSVPPICRDLPRFGSRKPDPGRHQTRLTRSPAVFRSREALLRLRQGVRPRHAATVQPCIEILGAEADRAARAPEARKLAATCPAKHRLGADAQDLGDIPRRGRPVVIGPLTAPVRRRRRAVQAIEALALALGRVEEVLVVAVHRREVAMADALGHGRRVQPMASRTVMGPRRRALSWCARCRTGLLDVYALSTEINSSRVEGIQPLTPLHG
jgi:hypothetical protein